MSTSDRRTGELYTEEALWQQLNNNNINKPKEDLLKLRNKLQGPSTMLEERCPSLVAGPSEGASLHWPSRRDDVDRRVLASHIYILIH